jgi:hypothetical protein
MTLSVRQYGGVYRFVEAYLGSNGITATIPSVATGVNTFISVTPTGGQVSQAPVGSFVRVAPQVGQTAGVTFSGQITAVGTITIGCQNGSGGTYNPGSQVFNVVIEAPESF